LSLALVSFIYILVFNDEVRTDTAKQHRALGIATMALAIIQVMMGAARKRISQHGRRDTKDPQDHGPRCVCSLLNIMYKGGNFPTLLKRCSSLSNSRVR
jgi:hypothetical protein